MTWRQAMQAALYGPGGFYARGEPPARHFRTSVHVSPGYAGAVLELLREVDAELGRPDRIDLVDVGAGRGELLEQVLAPRQRLGRPSRAGWPGGSPHARWRWRPGPPGSIRASGGRASPPAAITGLVIASEWLDNVPLDVVELTAAGPAVVQVDPATGAERPAPPARTGGPGLDPRLVAAARARASAPRWAGPGARRGPG